LYFIYQAINYAVELTVHMGVTVLGRVHWKKLLCFVLPMTGGKEQLRSIVLHVELSDGQTGSTLLFCVLNYFRAHSLRRTGQQSMHHLKEAEIHKSELAGILEIPIILGIQIKKNVRCQFFGRLGTQDSRISKD